MDNCTMPDGHPKPKGVKLVLKVTNKADLTRSVFKSEFATLRIAECDLENPPGRSRFLLLRDLLHHIRDEIEESLKGFARSSPCFNQLDNFIHGTSPFTLEIQDISGCSFIEEPQQGTTTSEVLDSWFYRTHDEDVEVGIHKDEREGRELQDEEGQGEEPGGSPATGADNNNTIAEKKVELLLQHVKRSKRICILSGAGVSTESGIPAYRGPSTVSNIQGSLWDEIDPETDLNIHLLSEETEDGEAAKELNCSIEAGLWSLVRNARPNPCHSITKKLSDRGQLQSVITQNIDGLYQKAGLSPNKVREIHGRATDAYCFKCGKVYDREQYHARYLAGEKVIRCHNGQEIVRNELWGEWLWEYESTHPSSNSAPCGGWVRLDTVEYGEQLDQAVWRQCIEDVEKCDLLICMGTSLKVAPVNLLPKNAIHNGTPVIIVNQQSTHFNKDAQLVVDDVLCGSAMDHVEKAL